MSGIGLGEAHGPLRVWSVLGASGWLGRCPRPVLCRVDNGLGWRTGDRRDMVLCSLMGRFGAEMIGGGTTNQTISPAQRGLSLLRRKRLATTVV